MSYEPTELKDALRHREALLQRQRVESLRTAPLASEMADANAWVHHFQEIENPKIEVPFRHKGGRNF